MKRAKYIGIVLILLLCSRLTSFAQKRNALVITDDRLVLTIDLKSSPAEIDSALSVAGINTKASAVKKGDFTAIDKDGWQLVSKNDDQIQFERLLTAVNYDPMDRPFKVTAMIPSIDGKPGYPAEVKYGVNKYAKITVYELSSGLTRFILPGFERSRRVFLSGSFNDWSTLKGLMKKTDGGWMLDMKLDAGAYEYKYIADGRWITDPNNLQRVEDGAGNVNSVYFKYNYTFKLAGHTQAQRIMVAGDFNDWNANELVMDKKANGWERQLYLGDGKHEYRFMADGEWVTDPANALKETDPDRIKEDKYASLNSIIFLGEPVLFKLSGYADAKRVVLAGDFDSLNENDLQLRRKGNKWILPLTLTAGNYSYRFIVDGKPLRDTANPHYSVKKGEEWSFLAVKPNFKFKLKGHGSAKQVTLCGVFNNWEPNGYTMAYRDNEWTISFHLKKGKYLYKFRVDGDWIIDPDNKQWEQNEMHTGNSVLWIE
jgi:hypothetical protein